jgi:LuxR family maltose regulon positive regulatory protein
VQPDYEAALTLLLNDLSRLPGKSALVLEDYHAITTAQIHEQLAFALDHLPATLHLVIVSRGDPPLPLARWRAQNQLAELRADDMQFSLAETHVFLQQTLPFRLPDDAIAHLYERTEGWVAGLHLIVLGLARHGDASAAAETLAAASGRHRHLADYLGAEVLETQPAPIQRFLLQTSVLRLLTASLCDAVTERTDSAAILE